MVKYRYFGPMLRAQAKWLNKMARRGWRLADTGKLHWNPAGEPGARISSERTNLDRELIIVERRAEAGEFRLYTTVEDELDVLRGMRRKHLYAALIFAAAGALAPALKLCTPAESLAFWVFAAIFAVLCAVYTARILSLRSRE